MHAGIARLVALACATTLLAGCDADRPLAPDADQLSLSGGRHGLTAPSNLTATARSGTHIELAWQDNSTSETGFEVFRSTSGPAGTFFLLATTGPNVTAHVDGGLTRATQYCYKVRAVERTTKKTFYSAFSATSCATTPAAPAAPSNLTAMVVSATRIDLTWTDHATDETGFSIERCEGDGCTAFAEVVRVAANVTRWASEGLSPSTAYRYRVRAYNDPGFSEYSNIASATTTAAAPPEAPTGTNTTPYGDVSAWVNVTWVDNSNREDGFRVERSLDGGATWTTARTIRPNYTSADDNGLTNEQQYCYRVFAYNAYGDSPPSPVDCTTPPAAPTNLTATAVDAQTIDLAWTDNSAVEDGYEVQRTDGISAYHIIALLPANSSSYRDADVTSDVTYSYQVRATKDGGGSAGAMASAAAATVPPSAPEGVDAYPMSSTQVSVNWSDNSTNEDGFRVERTTDRGATWATVTNSYPYGFVDGARTADEEVCYRVFAYNSRGDSPPSPTDCTTPPAGPTNLHIVLIDDDTMEVRWDDNSNVEDGYELWFYGYPYYFSIWLPPNTTSYQESTYYRVYGVVAVKDGGYSDWAYPPADETSSQSSSSPSGHLYTPHDSAAAAGAATQRLAPARTPPPGFVRRKAPPQAAARGSAIPAACVVAIRNGRSVRPSWESSARANREAWVPCGR